MEIHRVLVGGGFHLIDPDRAAASLPGREIARLAPFQGFLQGADAFGSLCGVKDQAPQRQQLGFQRFEIGSEYGIDRGGWRSGRIVFVTGFVAGFLVVPFMPRSEPVLTSQAIRAWIGTTRYSKRFRRRYEARPGRYRRSRIARWRAGQVRWMRRGRYRPARAICRRHGRRRPR